MTKIKKRKPKRNRIMATIAKYDPKRLRDRTVKPEYGKGRKQRPRRNDWNAEGVSLMCS
jgi:hypothetical protein